MLRVCVGLTALLAMNGIAGQDAAAELLSSRPITIIIPFTRVRARTRSSASSQRRSPKIPARLWWWNRGRRRRRHRRGGGQAGAAGRAHAVPGQSGSHAANASLYPTLSYDPIKDFRPITLMWSFPQLLAVPLDSPARSVAELVALAKSKPGGLSFASQGSGSGGHLLGEMFKVRTGANMVHIPYRGAGPAALDLAAGRVDFFFVSYSSVLPFLQAGKVRVIAVTSPKRLPALPDAPTMREVGFAGIELDAWFGLVAPAGTPDPVIDKLNAAFVQAVRDPDVHQADVEQGGERGQQYAGRIRGVHRRRRPSASAKIVNSGRRQRGVSAELSGPLASAARSSPSGTLGFQSFRSTRSKPTRSAPMATWTPDPTFYPSPRMAMKAPPETLAYVAAFDPDAQSAGRHRRRRCRSRLARPIPRSSTRWRCRTPATSCITSAGTPARPACAPTRRIRMSSGATWSCRACGPRASTSSTPSPTRRSPKIVKVIEPQEVAERAGYTRPHTVHCGPEGIYVAALGNREGKGPGGVFLMDHETFDVRGQWEMDRGPQQLRL